MRLRPPRMHADTPFFPPFPGKPESPTTDIDYKRARPVGSTYAAPLNELPPALASGADRIGAMLFASFSFFIVVLTARISPLCRESMALQSERSSRGHAAGNAHREDQESAAGAAHRS